MSCYFLTVSSLRPSPVLSLEHPFRPAGFDAWDEGWSVKGNCQNYLTGLLRHYPSFWSSDSPGLTRIRELKRLLLPGKDKKKKEKKKCVHLFFLPALNFIKANVYVNQKQGMTFRPANFLSEARTTRAFLCFLFLCCLLVSLARVTIKLGSSAVLVIQRSQSALRRGFLFAAGGEKGQLCCARWAAGAQRGTVT